MEMELTTEKEDERSQNKPQTAANGRGQINDQTAANSNQAVDNGEQEQPASRQSRYGRQLPPPPPPPQLTLEIMTHRLSKDIFKE